VASWTAGAHRFGEMGLNHGRWLGSVNLFAKDGREAQSTQSNCVLTQTQQ